MPMVVNLPPRKGSTHFSDEEVAEVVKILPTLGYRQAIIIEDEPHETAGAAYMHARVMRSLLSREGISVGTRAIETDDGFYAAVAPSSRKLDTTESDEEE